MPRGPRVLLNHVCYHLINRGNQKQTIFLEDADREKYLQILRHYKRRYNFKILGWCIMPNHVHLILQPKKPDDLPKIMQGLTQVYTLWFNKKYKKTGHLWQGRFKSMVIQKDNYFMDCVYYVEANPVRAGLVTSPSEYLWSSYRDRVFNNGSGLLDIPDST